MKQPTPSLTRKVLLFTAALCMLSAAITVYAISKIEHIARDAQHLAVAQRTALAQKIGYFENALSELQRLIEGSALTQAPQKPLSAHIEHTLKSNFADSASASPPHLAALFNTQALEFGQEALRVQGLPTSLHFADRQKWEQSITDLRGQAQNLLSHDSASMSSLQTAVVLAQAVVVLFALVFILGSVWVTHNYIARPLRKLVSAVPPQLRTQHSRTESAHLRSDEMGQVADVLEQLHALLPTTQPHANKLQPELDHPLALEQTRRIARRLPCAFFEIRLPARGTLSLAFISPAWQQLFDAKEAPECELTAAVEHILHRDPARKRLIHQAFRASAKSCQRADFVFPITLHNGSTRWIKTSATPFAEADGLTTFAGVLLDVTADMEQLQALQNTLHQATQVTQAIHPILAQDMDISHEIRTPLNAVLGLTQLLLKENLPDAQKNQLQQIWQAGQRLHGILNEVGDITKIEKGKLHLLHQAFAIQSLVSETMASCQELASKKNLKLHSAIAPDAPAFFNGDQRRIAQVLSTVITHTIKHSDSGHIDIDVRVNHEGLLKEKATLHFRVKNTAFSSAAEHSAWLPPSPSQGSFAPNFEQPSPNWGLPLAYALVQLMGGTLEASHTHQTGCSFEFTLSLLRAENASTETSCSPLPSQCATPHWDGRKVLVVDDNALNRTVAQGMLHAFGLQTQTAENEAHALFQLQALGPHYFCCVLMDVQMPHLDGIATTQALRALDGFEKLPIIAMTANSSEQDIERTQAAGMNFHLSKPLMESTLRVALEKCLLTESAGSNLAGDNHVEAHSHFDNAALDALAQLFDAEKLVSLVEQFARETQQRAQQLPVLAREENWTAMRMEAHKLTGTAATFGLLQLGQLSAELSKALNVSDTCHVVQLASQAEQSALWGLAQLRAHMSQPASIAQ